MEAVNLRTEYLCNPVGIDITEPRLFWNGRNGMTHIPYAGRTLHSRMRTEWKVKLWDETNTEGAWSQAAFFEMGLLHANDWKTSWITGSVSSIRPMMLHP